ncbi:hypothetical protein [Phyllobacterium sp. OV277]|uniref:hypothetical protein n=1 Tax=Phyllobacterium sp. OV277 TaxID=1882772 RepID=UPI0008854C25|nr:hypothetical protein [Phyllobacterium sp. OV277]SDP07774.1 hypothetical protein SAMN05443582_103341 [Phyllobacterium sp. OV277]
MAESSWGAENLDSTIVTSTIDMWSINKAPLLLSTLGSDLAKIADYRTTIAPLKLRQYIATKLIDKVVIVTHPFQPQKTGLIPIGEEFSFVTSETRTEESTVTDSTAASRSKERIKPSIWAAFVKPVQTDLKRFLDIGDDALRFVDLEDGPPSPRHRAIPAESITDGTGLLYDARIVSENIHKWAEVNGLAIEKLYIREQQNSPKNSFFEIFSNLSESDLRRIEIPFDIILKLAQK